MRLVVFETVQVLVALATNLATIWLLLLHAQRPGVRCGCLRVDDGKRAICVIMQLLIVVTMLNRESVKLNMVQLI